MAATVPIPLVPACPTMPGPTMSLAFEVFHCTDVIPPLSRKTILRRVGAPEKRPMTMRTDCATPLVLPQLRNSTGSPAEPLSMVDPARIVPLALTTNRS